MSDFDYEDLLASVEALIHSDEEPELERELSVNEWIGRLQGSAREAQQMARLGDVVGEERAWLYAAGLCLRRVRAIRENSRS